MTIDSTSIGDPERFVSLERLEQVFGSRTPPPLTEGRLTRIVRRLEGGQRETLTHTRLTRAEGVPGDAWGRADDRDPTAQITVMEAAVAAMIANGQSEELFGDQLFVTLELASGTVPVGSRIRIGTALLEVTPLPHNGCAKFRARFGGDALKFVSMQALRSLNLRGVYMQVIEDGEVRVDDAVVVVSRGTTR